MEHNVISCSEVRIMGGKIELRVNGSILHLTPTRISFKYFITPSPLKWVAPTTRTSNTDKTDYLNATRQYYEWQQCETALRTESSGEQLLDLHAITSMQTNCLVCMAEIVEVKAHMKRGLCWTHGRGRLVPDIRSGLSFDKREAAQPNSVKLTITSARPLWTTRRWSVIQITAFNRIVFKNVACH